MIVVRKSYLRIFSRTWIGCLIIVASCLEPYPPPPGTTDLNFLVVDGFLNSTNGTAQVKLTRTLPLDGKGVYPPEFGAIVQVKDENGNSLTVPEVIPGTYRTSYSGLKVGNYYYLYIRTRSGDEYQSDPVQLKQSPVLESVFWVREGDGITIKVDTRDPSGTTRYYQWLYSETWEYNSDRISSYVMRNGAPIPRSNDERIDLCFSQVESSKVLISSTSDQSGDFVNDFSLVHISTGSKKISRLYSINVQQRALDEESYKYWLQLQRSNENLGGLFDPLPSQVTGNIHPTTQAAKMALGYFSGGGVEEKRIYINFLDLPIEMRFVNSASCPVDSILVADIERYPDGDPVLGPYYNGQPTPVGYTVSTIPCSDCRSEGGAVAKPSFWPR